MAQEYIKVDSGSRYFYTGSNTPVGGVHKLLTYRSLHHLYYSNFNTGSGIIDSSSRFENYIESSISSSRKLLSTGPPDLPVVMVLFSIPRKYYGNHIEPGSIIISSSAVNTVITDDGEGNLISGSNHVGNVIYGHGQLIITQEPHITNFSSSQSPSISFESNVDVKTSVFNISISDYELNHTLNPSAQSGSTLLEYSGSKYVQPSGILADNVTGSAFQPYITTVGLYNDSDQLLAVAKLAQPLPKPSDTDLTIQIRLDV